MELKKIITEGINNNKDYLGQESVCQKDALGNAISAEAAEILSNEDRLTPVAILGGNYTDQSFFVQGIDMFKGL